MTRATAIPAQEAATVSDKDCRVCIVVLNWNNAADTVECLESLLSIAEPPNVAILVCDNASTDNSTSTIRQWADSRGIALVDIEYRKFASGDPAFSTKGDERALSGARAITLIQTGSNLGYGGGNNVGIRYALAKLQFDFLLILNNDTIVAEDAVIEMARRMRADERIGICGARIVYYHTPGRIQAHAGATYLPLLGRGRHIGANMPADGAIDTQGVEKSLDYVMGAAAMVSRRFLKDVGEMSEEYFLFFEELDWAIRGRRKGYRLGFATNAVVHHKEGGSTGSGNRGSGRSLLSEHYLMSSRIKLTRKYFPWFLPTVLFYCLYQVLRAAGRRDGVRAKVMMRAILGKAFAPALS